jgi:histidine triad (HIT) family protein
MTEDCVFCRIVAGEIPASVVAEGERWLAFRDLQPQAPVHLLVIPRAHVESVAELEEADDLGAVLLRAAAGVARDAGLEDGGYRVVTNVGEEGGQSVPHLHLHVLGGRPMRWPPG